MLNNKGQSLVLFILMVPILLGIMALVVDVGNVIYQKCEIDNTIEFILDYGLNLQLENHTELEQDTSSEEESEKSEGTEDLKELWEEEIVFTNEEIDKLKKLLDYNLKKGDNELKIESNCIVITSKREVNGIFSKILGFNQFKVESKYQGCFEDTKKKIQKIK